MRRHDFLASTIAANLSVFEDDYIWVFKVGIRVTPVGYAHHLNFPYASVEYYLEKDGKLHFDDILDGGNIGNHASLKKIAKTRISADYPNLKFGK